MENFIYSIIAVLFFSIYVLIHLKSYFHFQIYKEANEVENNYFSFLLLPFFNMVKWFKVVFPFSPSQEYSQFKNYKTACNLVKAIYITS